MRTKSEKALPSEGVLFLLPDGWRRDAIADSGYSRPFDSEEYFLFSLRCLHPFLQILGPLAVRRESMLLPETGWLVTKAAKQPWGRKEFFAMMHRFAENYGFSKYYQVGKTPLGRRRWEGRHRFWRVDVRSGTAARENGITTGSENARWRGHICFPALIHFRQVFQEFDAMDWNADVVFPFAGKTEKWRYKKGKSR